MNVSTHLPSSTCFFGLNKPEKRFLSLGDIYPPPRAGGIKKTLSPSDRPDSKSTWLPLTKTSLTYFIGSPNRSANVLTVPPSSTAIFPSLRFFPYCKKVETSFTETSMGTNYLSPMSGEELLLQCHSRNKTSTQKNAFHILLWSWFLRER